jgi:hypothetical protein
MSIIEPTKELMPSFLKICAFYAMIATCYLKQIAEYQELPNLLCPRTCAIALAQPRGIAIELPYNVAGHGQGWFKSIRCA